MYLGVMSMLKQIIEQEEKNGIEMEYELYFTDGIRDIAIEYTFNMN
jgi:hypothetical protein